MKKHPNLLHGITCHLRRTDIHSEFEAVSVSFQSITLQSLFNCSNVLTNTSSLLLKKEIWGVFASVHQQTNGATVELVDSPHYTNMQRLKINRNLK